MPRKISPRNLDNPQSIEPAPKEKWPTFKEIVRRLHAEGIYIHSEQLAEFFLAHGLPVDLKYVPTHLKKRAIFVNENYQGDLVFWNTEVDE